MTTWIPERGALKRPYYTSLIALMQDAISDGSLPIGTRLPPHRILAHQLDLSVHTISKAYDALKRRGLIDSQVGRGTYVLDPAQPSSQPFLLERGDQSVLDLSIARPRFGALHVEKMHEALMKLPNSLDPDTYLACRPNAGLLPHRKKGIEWLARCGVEATEKSVIMTNGVCHGLNVALAALARPGDVVVTEQISHHLIISLCNYLGIQLVGLEMDEEGVLPDSFEEACQNETVKAFFTTPSLAGPTAYLMSKERRLALIKIAQLYDVVIIEDDVLGPLVENGPPPIYALAPDHTIYLTSFTKCTLPGLRAGYLVAPDSLLPAIMGRLIVFSWMATPLIAELASRWIEDGTAEELVLWQRKELGIRYKIIEEEMAGLDWQGHPNALHFWLKLPEGWEAAQLVEHARTLGVAVASSQPFLTSQLPKLNAIRIAVGGGREPDVLRQGLSKIRNLLRRPPEHLQHPL